MIVVKVELHSAITGKITEIGRMHIANICTGTKTLGDYVGTTFKKPKFTLPIKRGMVIGHQRLSKPVWVLIKKMLSEMGY